MDFDRIKDMIYCELTEFSNQGQMSYEDVKIIGELVDILKDISEVEAMGNYEDRYYNSEYSMNNGYSRNGRGMRYYGGNSYGGDNPRTMMGRRNMRGRYSRDDAKDHMIQKLEQLLNEVVNEEDRNAIQKLIEQI